MYTEDYIHNGIFARRLILKVILILSIVILIIWLLPKFISYKPSNKSKNTTSIKVSEKNVSANSMKESLQKLKDAAIIYYKKEKLPKKEGDIELVTLKQLIKDKILTELYVNNKKCDINKSYAKLTKLKDDYLLKVFITCESKTDYLLIHVGEYDYCASTICEKDSIKEELIKDNKKDDKETLFADNSKNNIVEENNTIIEEKEENHIKKDESIEKDKDKEIQVPVINKPTIKLSKFSSWSSEIKTSCNTQEITCDINDKNCLKEVKVTKRIEETTIPKNYTTNSLVLKFTGNIYTSVCKNYNYVTIQGSTYRTLGNYDEILTLPPKTSTNSWSYKGIISTSVTPSFGGNKFYKFIGADYSNCSHTCSNGPKYYYDLYEYNYGLAKVSSVTEGCNIYNSKNVNSYNIAKQVQTVTRNEKVNKEVCYMTTRTRKLIN